MHEEIVKARLAARLSQVKLAELADVPRSQLRILEEGGNVTLQTLRKVVAQLPNLREMYLDGVAIRTDRNAEVRDALRDLIDAANRLLRLMDEPAALAAPEADRPAAPDPERERMARIRRIDALIDAGKPPLDDEH
ncbi:MAG TPA: helix-turn-helix transcriptional regulator [Thermoanaerobaculia bacterium]|jgi:transcriptional regulator with XRE-family HTH domain